MTCSPGAHLLRQYAARMKIINLDRESVTLEEVIELAREDPVSILTVGGDEVYVTHIGQERSEPTEAENPPFGAMTVAEVQEAIEEELALLDGRPFAPED